MPKTAAYNQPGWEMEPEVTRLADEVAKRGRQGQQNPTGARTSGLQVGSSDVEAPHIRGGEPCWRPSVPEG